MDQIRRSMVLEWTDHVARLIDNGQYRPTTANGWLAILRAIINSYVFEFELVRNPVAGIEDFDTRGHETYPDEEPNSLLPEEVPVFLAKMLELHPRHFAMVALGFGTGLRPSSIRPLRRRGPTPDVMWDEGILLVRRSHTRKQEVMETTKTGLHQRLKLPEELMDILRWHVPS
jgi:integrase